MNITTLPVIPLWPQTGDVDYAAEIGNIPTLRPVLPPPDKATGAAIVIFPGGGYEMLADHEGESGYARWLAARGIAALVVNYRLASKGHRHPAMLHDAARAVRLTRHHAAEWRVDPARVGVMGSSAGGHLASTILTHYDRGHADSQDPVERHSSRPDLGILCYPVITMETFAHSGSRLKLLGANPPADLVKFLSSEQQVTPDTPPCFIWHTWEDNVVPVENAIEFARALRASGVRFELHIYERGGHGLGLGNNHRWAEHCLAWLRERGFA